MCGIGGLIAVERLRDGEETAGRMAEMLRHRGPDGAAYWTDEGALLVHTRLGIIDLETGTQPLHNEDKTLWLTCNGEIFNYLELRAVLQKRGHVFSTRSDSEVILHLYEEYGLEFVQHLNGQFALCLWDGRSETAVLARDRVGIAPLYWAERPEGLWFASEAKAIIAGTREKPRLDPAAFHQLLSFWAPVAPNTLFADVKEVMPGEMLTYRKGRLNSRRYWDVSFPRGHEFENISEEQAAADVRDLLLKSTELRLRADVPVGAYLSGGLDSSIIATLIRRHSRAPLHTYSLTFADVDLDESRHQAKMVAQLQSQHFSVACSHSDILGNFEKAVWHSETPLIRTAPVPMSLLSGLVNRHGRRVVLTGEGADEVFGGYDIFKEGKLRHFWARNPQSQWRPLLIRRLYPYLNLSQGKANEFLATFFGGGMENPDHPLFSHQPRMDTTSRVRQFLSGELRATEGQPEQALLGSLPEAFNDWLPLCKAQYLEMKTLMPGYLLSVQGDRMLMQNSVEGRFPFLDHHLIEYVNRLHPRLKMRVFQEKFILKKSMENYLPESVLKRHKQPYRAPMAPAFIGTTGSGYVRYLLSAEKIKQYGYFESRKVELLLKKARSGRMMGYKDNMALVVILSTQCWHQQFIEEFEQRFSTDFRPAGPSLQRVA